MPASTEIPLETLLISSGAPVLLNRMSEYHLGLPQVTEEQMV
jgi:hypothetical protein